MQRAWPSWSPVLLLVACAPAAAPSASSSGTSPAGTATSASSPSAPSPPPAPASSAPEAPPPAAPPAPVVPPSVDPATLPEAARPLATLAQVLAAARVRSIARSDQLLEPRTPPLPVVSGTWVQDAEHTWLCAEEAGGEPHCVTLPGHEAVGLLQATQTQQYFVVATWTTNGRRTEVKMDASGAAQASQRPQGDRSATPTPLPSPATRPPPTTVLQALRGIDVVQLVDHLYASAGGHLTACRMTGIPVCTPPIPVEALSRGRADIDRLGRRRIGHEVNFGYTVLGEDGAVQFGTGDLLVRASFEPPSLVLLATIVGEAGSATPARGGTNDLFISTLKRLRDDCLEVERSRVSLTNSALGDRELPAPRLRRAPNEVPATGVDPLRVTMEGTWTVLPEGGLRRSRGRCTEEEHSIE